MRRRLALLAGALMITASGLAGCGGDDGSASDAEHVSGHEADQGEESEAEREAEEGMETAADRSVCRADADPVGTPYAEGFPQDFPFPGRTTVYDVEDREGTGVIVTGISSAPFDEILDFLNHDAVDAGFRVTSGETEEHDAEANWRSGDQTGRWAIRESADCPGETVIQVFAAGGE